MGTIGVLSQNELMALFLGVVVAVFAYGNRSALRQLPRVPFLLTAYLLLLVAWAAANAGHLFWPGVFEVLEHGCCFVSSLLLALWCWTALRPPREAEA